MEVTLLAPRPLAQVNPSSRPALTAMVVVIVVLALLPLAALFGDAVMQPSLLGGWVWASMVRIRFAAPWCWCLERGSAVP